jgi:CMP-N,N'-diacetyllegionaminic acid synthase
VIAGKTVLAIIPARGGSKGVPRKNIRRLAGKPLLAWTIEEAKKSNYIDRLVMSSEDEEIVALGRQWGCEVPFRRPLELARDETPADLVVLHTVSELPRYDYLLMLQVTSPLRTVEDIDGSLELCVARKARACVSVTEPHKSPYWMFTLDEQERLHPLLSSTLAKRRQDLPLVFALNGAIYIAETEHYLAAKTFLTPETIAYRMPGEKSLDIDTEYDILLFEAIMRKRAAEVAGR